MESKASAEAVPAPESTRVGLVSVVPTGGAVGDDEPNLHANTSTAGASAVVAWNEEG